MNKGVAVFLAILAGVISYIPAIVFYMRPQLTFGLAETFNIPLYMALGVSVFVVGALIAFWVRAYSVAVVVAFIPLIIFFVIGVIAGITFLFYKDIMIALIKSKVKDVLTTPLEGIGKVSEGVAKFLGK